MTSTPISRGTRRRKITVAPMAQRAQRFDFQGAVAAGLETLSVRDFERIACLVGDYCGIRLPASKKQMVEGRLRSRVRVLGHTSMQDYCRVLFGEGGLERELSQLVDAITTNKTDFFREPAHFQVLAKHAIPALLKVHAKHRPLLKIWSAACSAGQEPYSLAMVLSEIAQGRFVFAILGTDICSEVLEDARHAVYSEDVIKPVPEDMRRRYLMRSRACKGQFRIVPEIRKLVRFEYLNLMDSRYPIDRDVDVIFLRNVLIYFDKPTQKSVVARLVDHLRPGGYLFLGHSESTIGSGMGLKEITNAVFRRN
jgi:chemotaxis protein methyltransferase CheR